MKEEKYSNLVFQSLSHDLKTPIAVIKSHMEALNDKMISNKEFFRVLETQINTLEFKVHSLLYINKLDYLTDKENYQNSTIDIKPIIENSILKFKYIRPDIIYKTNIVDNTIFRGTYDAWETIIDNMFNNFIRYAQTEVKITVKNKEVILYNDGPSIDESILNSGFSPYKKGVNGLFGLGLSTVSRVLNMLGYEISVKNVKNGVRFQIK